MNDTSSAAEKIVLELLKQKGEAEKLFMGASMFDMARSITRAAILEETPEISLAEFRVEFFRYWYGEDFDPETTKKIIERVRG